MYKEIFWDIPSVGVYLLYMNILIHASMMYVFICVSVYEHTHICTYSSIKEQFEIHPPSCNNMTFFIAAVMLFTSS